MITPPALGPGAPPTAHPARPPKSNGLSVMGVVLVYSTLLILFNLVVDVVYRWVDPRIEMG